MKNIKITAFLLAVLLIFGFSGCKENPENSSSSVFVEGEASKKGKDYITLLYSAADTFNPYTAKTDVVTLYKK